MYSILRWRLNARFLVECLTNGAKFHKIVHMYMVTADKKNLDCNGADNFLGSLHVAKTDVLISASLVFPYFVSVTIHDILDKLMQQ